MKLTFHPKILAGVALLSVTKAQAKLGYGNSEMRLLNEADVLPVCQNGVFEPDPKKYYTIQFADGRFWSQKSHKPNERILLKDGNGEEAGSHWRFEASDRGVNAFNIKNRQTGQFVKLSPFNKGLTATGRENNLNFNKEDFRLEAECVDEGRGVFFE